MTRPLASTTNTPRRAARTAIGGAALALLALAALHVLRADLDPGGHMISEYAIGAHGWVMAGFFAAFALSSASLGVALASHARGLLGRVGLVFLGLATIGLVLGGVFPTDPAATPPEAMSFSGRMHGVGFMIGVPSELLGVLLLSLALRKQPAWSGPLLLGVTAVMWMSLGVMAPLLITRSAFFGVPNRTFMVGFAVWLIVAARPIAARARQSRPSMTGLAEAWIVR